LITPARIPGRYGRRTPKRAPALKLGPLLTGVVPTHPAAADYLAAMDGGWQLLGNDRAGDCNAVTWANMRRLVTATLATEHYPTQDQVWQFYRTQNPDFDPAGSADTNGPGSSADQGMDVQTGLEYLHATGGPDGVKAVAFAKVDHTNLDEVDAALAIFGALWLGIQVLDANPAQFSAGQPWTDVPGSAVEGGHAILGGGYSASEVRFITWAAETGFDLSFWNGAAPDGSPLVEECWVVIWPEHLGTREFGQGINVAQLAADYLALTGSPLPGPAPARHAEPPCGLPGHIGQWIAEHVAPEIADIRAKAESAAAKAERVLAAAQAHAANVEAIASLVVKITDAADPAAAPLLNALVPEAERALAEAERLAAELAGPQA
jgi:hypothetical protein